jgi:hypothetical protein
MTPQAELKRAAYSKGASEADSVYVMNFDSDRIRHMTKIWSDTISLKQLGWA